MILSSTSPYGLLKEFSIACGLWLVAYDTTPYKNTYNYTYNSNNIVKGNITKLKNRMVTPRHQTHQKHPCPLRLMVPIEYPIALSSSVKSQIKRW